MALVLLSAVAALSSCEKPEEKNGTRYCVCCLVVHIRNIRRNAFSARISGFFVPVPVKPAYNFLPDADAPHLRFRRTFWYNRILYGEIDES